MPETELVTYVEIPPHLRKFDDIGELYRAKFKTPTHQQSLEYFIAKAAITEGWPPEELKTSTINLKAFEDERFQHIYPERHYDVSRLSFPISKKDAHRITNEIINILRDPEVIFELLQDLDRELGEEMKKIGIEIEDNSPEYLIAGQAKFVLGPCKAGYKPFKKQKILEKILLRREQEEGINIKGNAIFVGSVDPEEANKFVADGNLFSEDERSSGTVLDHGKKTHRIAFEIFRQAVKLGKLNLILEDGSIMTHRQLLEFFVKATVEKGFNIWQMLIDNSQDSCLSAIAERESHSHGKENQNFFEVDKYCFSSRYPMILKSLITCFGDKITKNPIKNLCFYLRDSHYKQMAQNVDLVKRACMTGQIEDSLRENFVAMTDGQIYSFCALHVQTNSSQNPNSVFYDTAIKRARDELDSRYRPFGKMTKKEIKYFKKHPLLSGILSKNPSKMEEAEKGFRYKSLQDYADRKRGKEKCRTM